MPLDLEEDVDLPSIYAETTRGYGLSHDSHRVLTPFQFLNNKIDKCGKYFRDESLDSSYFFFTLICLPLDPGSVSLISRQHDRMVKCIR